MIRLLSEKPTLLGFIALFLWSTGSTTASFLSALPPFEVISIVFLAIFLITLTKIAVNQEWNTLKISWKSWLVAIFGIGVQQIFYILSYSFAPPAEADVIIFLWPLMALGLSCVLLGQSFKLRYAIASTLGILAISLLSFNKVSLANVSPGHVFALLCAMSWSLYTVLTRKTPDIGINVIGLSTFAGLVFTLSCHLSYETFVLPSLFQTVGLIYYCLGVSFGAYVLWTIAMQDGKANYLTLSAYMKPVLSILFLCTFGFAALSADLIVAVLMVVAGGVVSHPMIGTKIEAFIFSQFSNIKMAFSMESSDNRSLLTR